MEVENGALKNVGERGRVVVVAMIPGMPTPVDVHPQK